MRDRQSFLGGRFAEILTNPNSDARRQILESILRSDVRAAFDDAKRNKIVLSLLPDLLDIVRSIGTEPEIEAEINTIVALHHEMRKLAAVLRRRLDDAGICCKFVKGDTIASLYPANVQRQYLDIDILTPSIEQFWRLTELFISEQGRLIDFGLYRNPGDGEVAGNAVFTFGHNKENSPTVYVDVLIHAQQIFSGSSWSIADSYFCADERLADPERSYPAARDLVFQVIEIGDNSTVTIRDRFDFISLLNASEDEVRKAAVHRIRQLGMTRELDRILSACDEISGFQSTVRQMRSELLVKRAIWRTAGDGFIKRMIFQRLTTKCKTFTSGVVSFVRSLVYELVLAGYFGAGNYSALFDFIRRRLCPRQLYQSGHLVRFFILSVDETHRGPVQWANAKGKSWLRTPIAAMIPAPFGVADKELVEKVATDLRAA